MWITNGGYLAGFFGLVGWCGVTRTPVGQAPDVLLSLCVVGAYGALGSYGYLGAKLLWKQSFAKMRG